ncbi:50S ribosomal protein L24 [Ureaplasma sp. ES3154-GEN]|uniref:50S ribosomal protein L24 n=1 Tax=Ureaplasma sp. ES3154-GEN TaxID=2984844 RepID=UPI0021E8E577|nr:50S ribosomal protein L24 [Ureaplasma sp. ES3154-GEN]MCV3743615.1 50S ribosomal protein L24 [Ureaplasma sp. ES3154-GEN]
MNRIKKGDSVIVISGKNKQKTGIVIEVDPKNETAIVEGVNKVKRHQKKDQTHEQSGIIEKEAPIRLCKLALLETKGKDKGKPTKVSFELNKDNKKVRVTRKTRVEIENKK